MRSALICVFFALLVRRGSVADSDFRPTPIPLSDWHYDRRAARAGTLHETFTTESAVVAAVPAHYWEDALRHSVYLTLVRDKIDQLIAKGEVISPDSKPDQYVSKDIDDHDLWEKIKTAPFDRIPEEEPAMFGDVTILAKGRLMEERGGFRFTEDERSKEKCSNDKCMEGVKAFWSVKRVRQRETETSPGKYHYELTFSVSSQHSRKQKRPYENPVRTFTVRESSPDQALDMPQEHRAPERLRTLPTGAPTRATRAIWFHKNIEPNRHSSRQYKNGLDRIFSSFFLDDDDSYEPPRYRPAVPPPAPYPQYSKMGYVGSPSDQQKRLTTYPYRNNVMKYSRPIRPPPYSQPQHHVYASSEVDLHHPGQDLRFGPPVKPIRTTRPPVLPTPLSPVAPTKNVTEPDNIKQTTQTVIKNITESSTSAPDFHTHRPITYKYKPGHMKINYLPEQIRPPIYNAPPGVFVTMDKKPFKPMPPHKFTHKQVKHKPLDFRPSPQVWDIQQFSEPDPHQDTAFRPIMWNYSDTSSTERAEAAESTTRYNSERKTTPKGKKPPKKHEINNISRITTSAPEIITTSSDSSEESDAMQWANIVGAFSKTTPMESEKKSETTITESTTPMTTTTSSTTTPSTTIMTRKEGKIKRRTTTTTTAPVVETTTSLKPKTKRTRPPPKFAKPDKFKKQKRVTTSTTRAPESTKPTQDLTPQASSSTAVNPLKQNKTTTTTTTTSTTTPRPTTTTTPRPTTTTTTKAITTTTPPPKTEPSSDSKDYAPTTQPKINNRFRQSTLMYKGTSVKHDKWSAPTSPEKTKTTAPVSSNKQQPRRKGSNFQGYVSSTTPRSEVKNEKFHEDRGPSKTTTSFYEETIDQYESVSDHEDENEKESTEKDEQESRDHTEYIFQTSTTPSDRTNEIDAESITTEQVNTSPFSSPKNKTKCKKKTPQEVTATEGGEESNTEVSTLASVPVTEASTPSIFEELFGSLTVSDGTIRESSTLRSDLQEQGSEKHGQFVKLDDDLQDFLDSLDRDGRDADTESEYDDEEDLEPSIDDEEDDAREDDEDFTQNDEDSAFERSNDSDSKYESHDHNSRPYSLLELISMD